MSKISLQFLLEDDTWWTTSYVLNSWKGFQKRNGAYGSQSDELPAEGRIKICFAPEGRGNQPLTELEIASVEWLIENEAAISRSLLLSLLDEYPRLHERYAYPEERKALMPNITPISDFRSLLGLHSVNVHQLQLNGIPYVGFEFGCAWDEEEGLGILMHGLRTVRIGEAYSAIFLWVAEQDALNVENEAMYEGLG